MNSDGRVFIYKVEKVLPNNNYIVRRLGTNKTQLLHRIRLRKFTPHAPLADIFVRESDWQKDDQMPVAHDDLYAQSWNTDFGPNSFEDSPLDHTQNTDDIEYVPVDAPESSHPPDPPSLEFPKNSGESPVEQSTEREEQNYDEIQQEIQDNHTEISQKTPKESTPDTQTQKTP